MAVQGHAQVFIFISHQDGLACYRNMFINQIFSTFFDPKTTSFVFAVLMCILLVRHQRARELASVCRCCVILVLSSEEKYMTVSSAYYMALLCRRLSVMSFTRIRKSTGLRTLPWGTPHVIGRIEDLRLFARVSCVLPVRYCLNHCKECRLKPRFRILRSSMLWFTQSNAFLKFTNRARVF